MRKVLKRGTPHLDKVTCQHCKSVIQYTKDEEFTITKTQWGVVMTTYRYFGKNSSYRIGHNVRYNKIFCPVCNHMVTTRFYYEDLFDKSREVQVPCD